MLNEHHLSFNLRTRIEESIQRLESLLVLNVFRIFKEGLVNVIKHSRAKGVNIDLEVTKDQISLSIKDDGIGMSEVKGAGRGIQNMKSRAKELGGNLELISDHGTLLRLTIPLPIKYPEPGMD
jgi:signal transduction histidine kinase